MATIVCYRTNEVKEVGSKEYRMYDIVDGQQRLTTLIMLLKSVELKLDDGEDKDELRKIIVKSDDNLILLQTNNTNQHIFNNFLRNGEIPKKIDLKTHADSNIYAGIKDCQVYVNEWYDEFGDVITLFRIIRNKLGFVAYDTDDPRVVYSVFEVLNSRGLVVDWLDKCKSSMMGLAYEKAKSDETRNNFIDELNDLWGNIYEELATCNIPGHEILRVTATLYTGTEAGKPPKAETALASLKETCYSPEDTIKISKQIYEVAKKLVSLQSNVHLGQVINILQARVLAVAIYLTTSLSENERQKVLQQWEKVTFRIYGIFGKDARFNVGDYVRLANKIINTSNGISRYSEIMDAIRDIGSQYPVEKAIDEGLKDKDVYTYNQDVVRYILWRYEEHLAKKAGHDAIVNETFKKQIWEIRSLKDSIEHILPQNYEQGGAWDGKISEDISSEIVINSIGNLILLPMPLNNEAKRQGFLAKKNVYLKSEGLRMVQEITNHKNWSQSEIKEREEKILTWVANEWKDCED